MNPADISSPALRLSVGCLNVLELRIASGQVLARDLREIVSKPIFDIPPLVEAARHQCLDPILRSGTAE